MNSSNLCTINWELTSENIKNLLATEKQREILSDHIGKSCETVKKWCYNMRKPAIEDLCIVAKIFNLHLEDILVFECNNTQINKKEIEKVLDDAWTPMVNDPQFVDGTLFNTSSDLNHEIIKNIYYAKNTKIDTIEKFVHYLPLVDPYFITDLFARLRGNLDSESQKYRNKKLNFLYDSIPDSEAKKYADKYCEYYIDTPTIYLLNPKNPKYQ